MNYFEFNGRTSSSFGLHIESKMIFDSPYYDMKFQSIPGRNGDIILSNNRFSNVTVTYTCFFKEANIQSMASKMREIKAWLYSCNGEYATLTDSYDPNYFRYASLNSAISIDEQMNKLGSFTVSFSCKPFKYSYNGDTEESSTDGRLVFDNNEAFASYPIIKVKGYGAFTLTISSNGKTFEVNVADTGSIDKTVVIDCEKYCVYANDLLMNNYCTFSNGFPVLYPGRTTIRCEGDFITEISAKPRWCTL